MIELTKTILDTDSGLTWPQNEPKARPYELMAILYSLEDTEIVKIHTNDEITVR